MSFPIHLDPRFEEARTSLRRIDQVTPALRLLVGELMDRSQVLMSHYVRQLHGSQLPLYRTLVLDQSVEDPVFHAPL